MKSLFNRILVLCVVACLTFAFSGCKEEGSAEKAGKKIDQLMDSAKDSVEKATE